jgi:hypothetical protein
LGGHQNNYGGGTFDGYLAKYNVTFLGIEAAQNPLDARLYPNPTSDFVTLELLLEAPADTEITLYNQLGQLLLTQNYYQLSEIKHQFDISMLPSNMYWVEIKTKKGKSLLPLLKK